MKFALESTQNTVRRRKPSFSEQMHEILRAIEKDGFYSGIVRGGIGLKHYLAAQFLERQGSARISALPFDRATKNRSYRVEPIASSQSIKQAHLRSQRDSA